MAPTEAASPRDAPGTITVLHVDGDRSVAELTAMYLERSDDRIQVRVETDPCNAVETVPQTDVDCLASEFVGRRTPVHTSRPASLDSVVRPEPQPSEQGRHQQSLHDDTDDGDSEHHHAELLAERDCRRE